MATNDELIEQVVALHAANVAAHERIKELEANVRRLEQGVRDVDRVGRERCAALGLTAEGQCSAAYWIGRLSGHASDLAKRITELEKCAVKDFDQIKALTKALQEIAKRRWTF